MYCTQDSTTGNAAWAKVQALGQSINGTCNSGYYGQPSRNCTQSGALGVWGTVNSPCYGILFSNQIRKQEFFHSFFLFLPAVSCSADGSGGNATWEQSGAFGQSISGVCNPGFTGNPTRTCTQSGSFGIWGDIASPCTGLIFVVLLSFFQIKYSNISFIC